MTCRKTHCPIDFRVVVHYARSTGPATQLSARLVRCFSSEFPYTAARTGGQAHESERVLCPKLGKPLLEYLAARRTGRAQALRRSLSAEIVPTGGSGYRQRPMVGWIQRSGLGGGQQLPGRCLPYTAARTGGQAHESERVLCPKLGKPLLEYLAARRTGRAQALRRSLSAEIVPTGGSGYRQRPMVGWIQRSGLGGGQQLPGRCSG